LPDSGILVGTHSSQWTDGRIKLFLLFGNKLGHLEQFKLNVFIKKNMQRENRRETCFEKKPRCESRIIEVWHHKKDANISLKLPVLRKT
jgi:hypothetical protein